MAIFTISNLATVLTVVYLYGATKSLYNLMYPMNNVDLSLFPDQQLVKPYWLQQKQQELRNHPSDSDKLSMKVYLSTNKEFNVDFLIDEFQQKYNLQKNQNNQEENENNVKQNPLPQKRHPKHDSILLWEEPSISLSTLSKSFILTKSDDSDYDSRNEEQGASPSYQHAVQVLNDADEKEALLRGESTFNNGDSSTSTAAGSGSSSEAMNALFSNTGDGIETTSVILSLYKIIGKAMSKVVTSLKGDGESSTSNNNEEEEDKEQERLKSRIVLPISKSSSIWSNLMKNSTVNVHVILVRNPNNEQEEQNQQQQNEKSFQETFRHLQTKQSTYNLLSGGTNLVKHDLPHHISKPKRFLYNDILYIICTYILRVSATEIPPPWQMEYTKPKDYQIYHSSILQKEDNVGYPYWKPEVAVKLVSDDVHYPLDFVGASGMEVIRVDSNVKRNGHESGYAYLPGLYVDEIGLTSERYIPLNETVDALPLRISFDTGSSENYDNDENSKTRTTTTSGGLSPGRWRLLSHLSNTLEGQKELGFDQSDIDDVRRLIADTNVTLLAITIFASTLHLLFEFLTFKNDVEFWRGNKDLTGLSVRALFMDFFSQFIILLFLIEKESSLLMTLPAAAGCLIALWKCQKGAGFRFVKVTTGDNQSISIWNRLFRLFGYELHAMRLRAAAASMKDNANKADREKDLATLTEEMDRLATNSIGTYLFLPLVLGYTVHTLINEEHSGWWGWFITSASAVVYAVGFVLMTPQLFLNYKLKSVAHLPWRVLGYRFVNTFIDDLFAMIIRMPTMARISCFRDDVVFVIYLWQRYLYPVDASRPVEGGGMDAVSQAATSATLEGKDKNAQEKEKRE